MAVYFIQNPENGLIKIGKSIDVGIRIKTLSRYEGVSLDLLGTIDGYSNKEEELHQKFEGVRRHGEWFAPTQEILDFIKVNTSLDLKIEEKPRGKKELKAKVIPISRLDVCEICRTTNITCIAYRRLECDQIIDIWLICRTCRALLRGADGNNNFSKDDFRRIMANYLSLSKVSSEFNVTRQTLLFRIKNGACPEAILMSTLLKVGNNKLHPDSWMIPKKSLDNPGFRKRIERGISKGGVKEKPRGLHVYLTPRIFKKQIDLGRLITGKEMAEEIGIKLGIFYRYKNGSIKTIDLAIMQKLAEYFGCRAGDLLSVEDEV